MARTVHCVKLKKEAEGLAVPPLPGPKGQWVYENVSQTAWSEWQAHQTRLINEKHLNLLDPETRKYLTEQMDKFFAGEDYDTADGFVPEQK
ncbi:oxidative damage protection protein [Endozoicomonas sp. ALD040]|uniref:oxidative damage protection protein n=1 Tax=unclassified Endozoicomonas TaxID=2644528 RepID=UPI003BB0CAC7